MLLSYVDRREELRGSRTRRPGSSGGPVRPAGSRAEGQVQHYYILHLLVVSTAIPGRGRRSGSRKFGICAPGFRGECLQALRTGLLKKIILKNPYLINRYFVVLVVFYVFDEITKFLCNQKKVEIWCLLYSFVDMFLARRHSHIMKIWPWQEMFNLVQTEIQYKCNCFFTAFFNCQELCDFMANGRKSATNCVKAENRCSRWSKSNKAR